MSAARISVAARIQRLLAILQWIAAQPDGAATVDVCERFGLARADLVRELEMASMIGADSTHYDEMPFEVIIEDGRIWVRLFSFGRPLRLTPAEALALVAAADALLDDGARDDSPLARALEKLARSLGISPDEVIEVDLDPDGGPVARALGDAIGRGRRVRFTYWSYGRDEVAERVIDPWQVFTDRTAWYLVGLDVERDAQRRFRLDRIAGLVVLDEAASPRPPDADASIDFSEEAPTVVLDLPAEARWVVEAYPVLDASAADDGRFLVTLAVSGTSWLERLLLRVGPSARVVSIDPALGDTDLLGRAARRILARYRGGTAEAPR